MAAKCMSRRTAKITLGFSVVIFVLSLTVLLIFPTLYQKILKKEIALTDGSLITNIWKDIPLPIYERLYFFNITNGDQFVKGQEKLNITEVGPYTYVARWVKKDLVWNPNGTVSYKEVRTYHFVEEESVGSQDDEVYSLNGPMIIASDILKHKNIWVRMGMSIFFRFQSETVVTKKRIRELVYDGYEDIIIKLAPILKPNIPYKNGIFSWLYGKNATDDGTFTVFTGVDDQSKTNFIDKWNGENKLSFWKGDTCNSLNGTSVEAGPPLIENQETYTFYQSIFCRSLTFNYSENEHIHGVPVKRFLPNPDIFANGTENPDNACFDLDGGYPSGVLDISPCQFDAPAFMSFPHFHMADPSYLDQINGLNPNSVDHGSFLDVEPITGMSVNIRIRFQMNLKLQKVRGLLQFDNVLDGIFPVFWVELSVAMDQHWADFLTSQLNTPKIIVYTIGGILCFASFVLLVCSMVVLYGSKDDDDELLLIVEDDENCRHIKRNQKVPSYTEPDHVDSSTKPPKDSRIVENRDVTNNGLDLSSEDITSAATESSQQYHIQ